MIPPSWTPVHRPSDAEHVGYLAPDGIPGLVVPTSLVGLPLGPARPSADAAESATDWSWRPVVLGEASPSGFTVRLEMAEPAELRARAALPVPVGDLLLEQPPT